MAIKFKAKNKNTGEILPVLSIDFVNESVWVLPERELEGGNQEEWSFSIIDLKQSFSSKSESELDMDLRDYFAAQAMSTVVKNYSANEMSSFMADRYAKNAYNLADAMIKIRKE